MQFLIYLLIFVLYINISECAAMLIPTSATFNPLTTTESALTIKDISSSSSTHANKLRHILEKCQNSWSWMCLKLELIRQLENLNLQHEIHLINGISLMKDPLANEIKITDLMTEVSRNYPNDPAARLNGYIINKVYNILQSHYLRFKLIDDTVIEEARSVIETGRKDKFGKKGGMEALLAAGLMMKGTLMAMGMGGITLIAGKALITALMALTMATVVGLKGLTSSGGKSHTYEIVTKPIYTSSHSHSVSHDDGGHGAHFGTSGSSGYGGYARTLNLNLPHSLRGEIKGN